MNLTLYELNEEGNIYFGTHGYTVGVAPSHVAICWKGARHFVHLASGVLQASSQSSKHGVGEGGRLYDHTGQDRRHGGWIFPRDDTRMKAI